VARALHRAGPRRGGPLVEVDAAALPTPLFEGELFGWRAGAFTGADESRDGRVARAAGGSLLLDHIEELPLAVQPKLLRLLAEHRYAPLGGVETEADVRFIATGPDDLAERVERGAFRADLYYRLGVLSFRLPPLRERRAELPALAAALTADLADRFGLAAPPLAAEALGWMERYGWPGNLTELRNVLERALVMGGRPRGSSGDPPPLAPEPPAAGVEQPPRSLAETERAEILRALAYTRGHQGRAAALLGVSRKALWEKRRRHGIP
jgi:DNA-binding NtrC family response regulator